MAAIAGLAGIGATQAAFAKKPSPVALFDTDNDGTVDLAEAKKAASDLLDRLDREIKTAPSTSRSCRAA